MAAAPFLPLPPSCLSPMTAAQSKGRGLSQLPPHAGIKCPPWLCSGARTIPGRGGLLGPGNSSSPRPSGDSLGSLASVWPARACRPTWAGGGYRLQLHSTSPSIPSPPSPIPTPKAVALATPSDAEEWPGASAEAGCGNGLESWAARDPGSPAHPLLWRCPPCPIRPLQASGHAPSLDHAHFRRQEGETGPPKEQPGGHKLQPLFSDSGLSHKQSARQRRNRIRNATSSSQHH